MSYWSLILLSAGYLGLLAGIAYAVDSKKRKRPISPYIYALSLAVYCTSWTYYGSVGKAAVDGISFVAIYVGPIITMPLWWIIVRKIIRISNALRLNSLADFISARFGKSIRLSVLVTLLSVVSIVPYIAIQIKAVTNALSQLLDNQSAIEKPSLIITFIIGLFVLIIAFRTVNSNEKHSGLVTIIALDSIVKLVAFLSVGLFVTYGMFDGYSDIFRQVDLKKIDQFNSIDGTEWFTMILLSMSAIIFLPRQFHMAVTENQNVAHLKKAIWLFPVYLVLINLFVIPIALGGELILGESVDPDNYVLALPQSVGNGFITLFTYVGGFSAATSMIMVSTIALSIMVSNNIVMPLIIKNTALVKINTQKTLFAQRFSVILILTMSYLYFAFVANSFSLSSIGLISFVAGIQFAPVFLGSLYWRGLTKSSAVFAMVSGFLVWFYTLVIPNIIEVGLLPESWLAQGPYGIAFLNPEQLFGLHFESNIVHATYWSMLFNILGMVVGIYVSKPSASERNMANYFVEAYNYSTIEGNSNRWTGQMVLFDITRVLENILGKPRVKLEKRLFKSQYDAPLEMDGFVNPEFIGHAENLLNSAVGAASARMIISSIAQEDNIAVDDVLVVVKEKQQFAKLNAELHEKSKQLLSKTAELEKANERLKNLDKEKDDFISTVTHEMRTPLTSIRAMTEIIYDNQDLEEEERNDFLNIVIHESERMTRLINQVLDLEKLQSRKTEIYFVPLKLHALIWQSIHAVEALTKVKNIRISCRFDTEEITVLTDQDRMQQVLINLLSNAIKFSNEGGEIVLRTSRKERAVIVSVADQGKGILKENQERVFEKFFQANDQTLKKPVGTGLGLAITKEIVEMHGGNIWIKSEVERGTTILFSLPIEDEKLVK
ncbi:MAG: ATP-binding protein [Cyclobacteriaceae bacterium]